MAETSALAQGLTVKGVRQIFFERMDVVKVKYKYIWKEKDIRAWKGHAKGKGVEVAVGTLTCRSEGGQPPRLEPRA